MTIHDAIVQLSPWTHHHPTCARTTSTGGDCDCGLQDLLRDLQTPDSDGQTQETHHWEFEKQTMT